MAYDDVPTRLLDGTRVPMSEVIAWLSPMTSQEVRYRVNWFELLGLVQKDHDDGMEKISVTAMGFVFRLDLIKRIDGDCPDDE